MPSIRIVALSIVAAVAYGILHDLVTAHVCVEYFTIGHPTIVDSQSPVVMALVWGVLATWWVGAILGALLAVAARAGPAPPWGWRRLVRPIATLLAASGVLALAAGIVGRVLAANGLVFLVGDLADRVPRDRHFAFLADLWAHSASYAAGFVGGAAIAVRTWRGRIREGLVT